MTEDLSNLKEFKDIIKSIEEKKYCIDRNIRHLQIMNNKEWFTDALEEDQVTQIADCIVAGTSFIDSN